MEVSTLKPKTREGEQSSHKRSSEALPRAAGFPLLFCSTASALPAMGTDTFWRSKTKKTYLLSSEFAPSVCFHPNTLLADFHRCHKHILCIQLLLWREILPN